MRQERYKSAFKGGIFHVYNRGVDKRKIFLDEDDYVSYLERLTLTHRVFGITTLAYCLMPNHIHLLLRQDGNDPAAKLISSLHTSHAKRFNEKYDRTGHLYQGRFRQAVIQRNEHLLYVIAYIHLNPVEAGLVKKPEDHPWSSHRDYLDAAPDSIVNADEGLSFFGGKTNYRSFIDDLARRAPHERWKKAGNTLFD